MDEGQEWRGPTDDLMQIAADHRVQDAEPAEGHPFALQDELRFVDFTQSDDREITLKGPQDLTISLKIASLIERDRALGCGALEGDRLYILFRVPRGERPGRVLIGERPAVEALILEQYDQGITKAELKLILQTLAGLSLQISAVRDRVSIETKKSQSKSMLSKLGYPDLGHLRAVLLASLTARLGGGSFGEEQRA